MKSMRLISLLIFIVFFWSISSIMAEDQTCSPRIGWIPFTSKKAQGNATSEDVLQGKSFSNSNSINIIGEMLNNESILITPGTSNIEIPKGYHDGTGFVVGDQNLIPENLVSGREIFGVKGTAIRLECDVLQFGYCTPSNDPSIPCNFNLQQCVTDNYGGTTQNLINQCYNVGETEACIMLGRCYWAWGVCLRRGQIMIK